ncbi:hypothetical protein BOTBODRAFT_34148 [Botryobasidium botryosum FD-172 SS1]|uniref:Uncharacterized protein n=1 Tax=Botryobasidium botryosum (strain FD-172 SS1) TaxID=930990 RepID=A0A067MAA4_BOTB1|nr:hypothetical protein BOTBODRAFT_34148 [Botryobasidium botryosum FD-172 SS1]
MLLLLIAVVLVICAVTWCFLSTCLGAPFRRMLSRFWEDSLEGSRLRETQPGRWRRQGGGQEEWEMGWRGRRN